MFRYRRRHSAQQGAAMVVAIVVSMVIMVFSLSLLLVTYSLYSSVQGNTISMQCRELAVSLSAEVGQELMQQAQPEDGAAIQTEDGQNPLYSYLRAMLWQEEVWQHYDPEGTLALEECCKYFALEIPDGYGDMADQIWMTLYWTIEEPASPREEQEDERACAVLHVRIRVSKNEASYVAEKAYVLHVSAETYGEQLVDTEYGTTININERWSFSDWIDGN